MNLCFKTCLIFLLISSYLYAQDINDKKSIGNVGISFSSFGDYSLDRKDDLIGAASYDSDNFFTIGINYLKPVNSWLEFETGIEYSRFSGKINPNLPPDINTESSSINFSLINIPLTVRANFLKYLFVNGGCFVGFDSDLPGSIDTQSGIGLIAGLGVKYDFKFGASIYINPYSKFHSLISFSPSENRQKVYENGIRIGFMYNLK